MEQYVNETTFLFLKITLLCFLGMRFRFQAANDSRTKGFKNHCREIVYTGDRPSYMTPFGYDCHWSDQQRRYENETFIFESLAFGEGTSDYKKYVFKVPPVRSLGNNLVYLVSSSFLILLFCRYIQSNESKYAFYVHRYNEP
jgi:hypothetical protein